MYDLDHSGLITKDEFTEILEVGKGSLAINQSMHGTGEFRR
jgi:Ca2+-binding EF-hand superfamily protein